MAITATPSFTHSRAWTATLADLISLTKPRIVELLLITTVPAMVAAAGGWPGGRLLAATVIGGALVSGSAHATNMVIDRDIDAAMTRTAHRPLPTGRLAPSTALAFAMVLLVVGSLTVWIGAGWLPATLTVGAWLWYVVVYTLLLKRHTVHNITIGGLAGAMPPAIGWAAVTGRISVAALLMVAIVTLWTPIHFWALAIGTGQDYANAKVPMLPVVKGAKVAARHGAAYALATAVAALLLPVAGVGGIHLVGPALLLGAMLVGAALLLVRDPSPRRAWRTFHISNGYLAGLFVMIAITAPIN